jgi:ribosomal protein S18 acetylase RimI-like enzyme
MDGTTVELRRATLRDVDAIAAANVATWRETYWELFPTALLEAPDFIAERRRVWDYVIRYAGATDGFFVLVDESDRVLGYASSGAARDRDLGFATEVCTLYLRSKWQGAGWGRRLWEAVRAHHGCAPVYLWTHAEGPSISFYRHMGGREIARRESRWHTARYPEVAFGFAGLK